MKDKVRVIMSIAIIILAISSLVISFQLNQLSNTVQAMNRDEHDLSQENRMMQLEDQLQRQFLTTEKDLNRLSDLLSKVQGLDTLIGTTVAVDQSNGILFDVEIRDTKELIQLKVADNCTFYLAGQFTSERVDTETFLNLLNANLANNTPDGFTFKIVNGQAVQVYQGWGDY